MEVIVVNSIVEVVNFNGEFYIIIDVWCLCCLLGGIVYCGKIVFVGEG